MKPDRIGRRQFLSALCQSCRREENCLKKEALFIRRQLLRNQVPRTLFRSQIVGDEVDYQDRYI